MKKIDIYIIKKFLGTFFFSISLLIVIVVVFDISEKIDDFLEKDAPLKEILFSYYLNFIPYFVNLFSYLFTFIAVIFFTSKMASGSEIIAILSSGVSFWRLLWPYMIAAAFLGLMSFYLANFLIPHTNKKMMVFEKTITVAPSTGLICVHLGDLWVERHRANIWQKFGNRSQDCTVLQSIAQGGGAEVFMA